jgi:flagellar basal-body rod protein FlgB
MKVFDRTLHGLERSMDLRFKRHAVLASNVANSETPGYRARELDFAGQLEQAFRESPTSEVLKTNPRHIDVTSLSGEHIILDSTGAMGADGNNVDIDVQMGKVSTNARAYESAAGLVSQKFRMIKQFIRKGGV